MRDRTQYLLQAFSLRVIVTLSITFIFIGSCSRMGGWRVSESPALVHTEFSYYPNGQKEYAAEYLNGKLDGISRHWSEDGFLISESEYTNGKLNGIWKKYYSSQNIMQEAYYFHGQKHGKVLWYYENGQLKSEQSFHYGEPVGIIIRWYPDGSIIY